MSLFIVHSDRLAALKKREGMCQESWRSISPSDVSEARINRRMRMKA
jgi:hypothetical protein